MVTKKSKKVKRRSDDDLVAEFLAFEKSSPLSELDCEERADTKDSVRSVCSREESSLEYKIDNWLSSKGIFKETPDTKKQEYFNSKKESVRLHLEKTSPFSLSSSGHFIDEDTSLWSVLSSGGKMRKRINFNFDLILPSDGSAIESPQFQEKRKTSRFCLAKSEHEVSLGESQAEEYLSDLSLSL